MNINDLLNYARIDAEMTRLSKAFSEEEAVKTYKLLAARYKEATELITRMNAEAEDIIKQIGGLQERYNDAMAELAEYRQNAASIEDENEADFYSKNVEKLIAVLGALSTEIAALSKRIADIRQQTGKASSVVAETRRRLPEAKKLYDDKTAEYRPKTEDIRKRLAEAAKAADLGEVLAIYQNLKKSNVKMPIRPISDGVCGGCSMGVDSNTISTIKTTGYVLCPNCGRILYSVEE